MATDRWIVTRRVKGEVPESSTGGILTLASVDLMILAQEEVEAEMQVSAFLREKEHGETTSRSFS